MDTVLLVLRMSSKEGWVTHNNTAAGRGWVTEPIKVKHVGLRAPFIPGRKTISRMAESGGGLTLGRPEWRAVACESVTRVTHVTQLMVSHYQVLPPARTM